jgi:Hydroxymethylglutaryl-coenzyme A reductase
MRSAAPVANGAESPVRLGCGQIAGTGDYCRSVTIPSLIVAATVLCGELSLGSAIAAEAWLSSHEAFGLSRP